VPESKTPGKESCFENRRRKCGSIRLKDQSLKGPRRIPSKRTLNRRFQDETNMSFQDWRQQCRLLRGLEMLVAGDSVTRVALELGYEHSSAFIVMFKRCLGSTPRRYLQLKN
jgi:methylphosphotriester-DNA--protein-cysteine methyltransferase